MPLVIRNGSLLRSTQFAGLASLLLLSGCGATATRTAITPATVTIPLAVDSVTPVKVLAGSGPAALTLTGTGFTHATSVQIGGFPTQAVFLSSTQLALTVSESQTATGAILDIVAVDGQTVSASSAPVTLEVDNPTPRIALLTPASLPLSAVPGTIILQGSGFLPSTTIEVNGSARSSGFLGSTQISLMLNASDTAIGGTLSLTATNPSPAGGQSGPITLAVDNPAPGPLTLSPSSVLAYSHVQTPILISGTNFLPDSIVLVNGVPRETQYRSATQVEFELTVADQAATGALPIAVLNRSPGGGNSATSTLTLTDVVYASTLPGVVSDSVLTPGAQVTGADAAASLQEVLNRGGIHLVIDGRFTLFASLILYSNDEVEVLPGAGLIMASDSNCEMFLNGHPNAPDTPSGTGGFLVSNQIDHNISIVNQGILNFNSTGGAVTGADSLGGNNALVQHKSNPATGKQVNGLRFVGVNGLSLVPGEMYDSGTFTMTFANDSNVDIGAGNIHHPMPLVQGKNTDGLHFFGPDTVVHIHDLDIASGDDAIGLNADDIQEPQTYNFEGTAYQGVLHGPITKVNVEHVRLHNSLAGIRLLSLTELIDQITVSDVTGTTLGPGFVATKFFASGGLGHFGTVSVDGYDVMSLNDPATRLWNPIRAAFELDGNWKSFSASNLRYAHPASSVPLLRYGSGKMQSMTVEDLSLDDQTGSIVSEVFQIGGRIEQLTATGTRAAVPTGWPGSIFSGTQPPEQLIVNGYSGPSALLALNWSDTARTGDAFPFANGNGVSYALRTAFDEGRAGESLIGTLPAMGAGTWLQPSGAPPMFVAGGIDVPDVDAADATVIDTGLVDGTVNYTFAAFEDGWSELALRYSDRNHYIAVVLRTDHLEVYDITDGVAIGIGHTLWPPPLNSPLSVTLLGNNITLSDEVDPPLTATLPSNTANTLSTEHGFIHFGGGYSPMILSGMTATP